MQKHNVGIVTFFPNNNFGCLLQAYSLNKFTSSIVEGNVETIYFEPSWKYLSKRIFPVRFFLGIIRFVKRHKFLSKSIPFCEKLSSKKHYSINSLNKESFDILIAGSDQIWHPNCFIMADGGFDFYFLNFNNHVKKKIAYAPSLSTTKWPDGFEKKALNQIKKFDAVSIREISSAKYLQSLGVKQVACVCDPTILHTGSFYKKEFDLDDRSENYCFIYKIREIVPKEIEDLIQTTESVKIVDLKKERTICSVKSWLQNILGAKFIITDSFHCAVFCILFHKPFVVLANHGTGKGMNERFQTLLGRTDLLYRVLPSETTNKDVESRLNRLIDWKKIDSILEEWRIYSANWLKESLEK